MYVLREELYSDAQSFARRAALPRMYFAQFQPVYYSYIPLHSNEIPAFHQQFVMRAWIWQFFGVVMHVFTKIHHMLSESESRLQTVTSLLHIPSYAHRK